MSCEMLFIYSCKRSRVFMVRDGLMCGGLTVSESLLSAVKWAADEKPRPKLAIIGSVVFAELFVGCYHRQRRCHHHTLNNISA